MTKSTPAVPEELREFPTQQPKAVMGSTRRGTEGRWLGAQPPLRAGETEGQPCPRDRVTLQSTPTGILGSLSFPKQHSKKTRTFFRKNSTI